MSLLSPLVAIQTIFSVLQFLVGFRCKATATVQPFLQWRQVQRQTELGPNPLSHLVLQHTASSLWLRNADLEGTIWVIQSCGYHR
ncbi:hypothetical protein Y1Q_0016192 [Alligator mississippiensis]|uniref:Secreted protein n=1 Tax=Alligator mississippiensis TaxID=8496 RepID=A0A151P1K8_ALLMI|nr:hypothetical protein Y1Q_0016192 [Alligator mississippiensis]